MFTLSEMTEEVARLQVKLDDALRCARDFKAAAREETTKRHAAEIERDQWRAKYLDAEAAVQVARRRILELEDEGVTIRRQRGW